MAGSIGRVHVEGLDELIKAFRKFDKDLTDDLIYELEEAADPVRKATTQYLLGELQNLPRTPAYAAMRIGVARSDSTVYVVPQWRSRASGTGRGRARFGESIRKRMDRAVEDKAGEVEDELGKFLDRLADDWGR